MDRKGEVFRPLLHVMVVVVVVVVVVMQRNVHIQLLSFYVGIYSTYYSKQQGSFVNLVRHHPNATKESVLLVIFI